MVKKRTIPGLWVRRTAAERAVVDAIAEHVGLPVGTASSYLLDAGVTAFLRAPTLPVDEALALINAYWSHYFSDPVVESLAMERRIASSLGEDVEESVGRRLMSRLSSLPGEARLGLVLRLMLAFALIRKHDVPVDEAIVRTKLAE